MARLVIVPFLFVAAAAADKFGELKDGAKGVKEMPTEEDQWLSSKMLWETLSNSEISEPLIFRNSLEMWVMDSKIRESIKDDETMVQEWSDIQFSEVEHEENGNPVATISVNTTEFALRYENEELFASSDSNLFPARVRESLYLPPWLNCGGFTKHLNHAMFWMTQQSYVGEVYHSGKQNRLQCSVDGETPIEYIIWYPRDEAEVKVATDQIMKEVAESPAEGECDAGSRNCFLQSLAENHVTSLKNFERIHVHLAPGDCLVIPSGAFQVEKSPAKQRQISIYLSFDTPATYDEEVCVGEGNQDDDMLAKKFSHADCAWRGNEDTSPSVGCKIGGVGEYKKPGADPAKLKEELDKMNIDLGGMMESLGGMGGAKEGEQKQDSQEGGDSEL